MRSFGSVILLLVALFAIAIALALAIGSTRALPLASTLTRLSTNPDGTSCQQPCLLGAAVGQDYLLPDIIKVLLHPLMHLSIGSTVDIGYGRDREVYAWISTPTATVFIDSPGKGWMPGYVVFMNYTGRDPIILGEVVSLWGTPDYMCTSSSSTNSNPQIHLVYSRKGAEFVRSYSASDHLTPQDSYSITIAPSALGLCDSMARDAWRGFSLIKR